MRPKRKTTARSYSLRILMPLIIATATMTRNIGTLRKDIVTSPSDLRRLFVQPLHFETHPFIANHLDLFADINLAVRLGIPIFAVHEDLARPTELAAHLAELPDESLQSHRRLGFLRAKNQIADGKNEGAKRRHGGKNDGTIDDQVRALRVEQEKRSQSQRDNPTDPKNAEAWREGFSDKQADAKHNQRQAGVVDRQDLQSGQRQ